MSAASRRRLSIALLPLAWAAACGGTVLERTQGDSHGGAGGDSAVFIGNSGGSGAGPGATLAGGNAPGSAGYATGSAGYATGSGGYATGSGGYPIGDGGAPPFGGMTSDSGTGSVCAGIAERAEVILPDILILLDRSISMSCPLAAGGDRWTAVKAALSAYVMQSPSGQSVGLAYFEPDSSGDAGVSCNPADYQTPDVELAPLSTNTKLILDSLERHSPGGERPTLPALVGAMNHAVDWGSTHRNPAVVLVTDGAPDACGSLSDVEGATAAGSKNGVETFVIGLLDSGTCNLNPNPTNQKDIDAIAQVGGSLGAFGIDLTSGVDAQLMNALGQVVLSTAPSCRYQLPYAPPNGQSLDPAKVNVEYTTVSSTEPTVLLRVASSSACDPMQGGWYYDNPNDPKEIDLCPASCNTITERRGDVNIVIGCATKRP